MPGSAFAADLQYPDLTRYESTEQKLAAVQDYLFLLLETLRYVLRNLSMEENFNQAELKGWVDGLDLEAKTVVAESVIVNELYGDFGDIADLTVNELRTDYQRAARYLAGNVASLDYLHVHDEEIGFITGVVRFDADTGEALTEQLHHGTRYFWWKDATHERMTSLEDTGLPVIVYQYTEQVKGRFSFVTETEGGQTYTVPVLKLGYGSDAGGVNGTAKLVKHASGLELSNVTGSGKQLGMWQRGEGWLDLKGLRKPTKLDFSHWDPVNGAGQFTETRDGGIESTYSVQFDQTGNPVKFIDDTGHETAVRWNRELTYLAYVQSTGTQYVNTGYEVKANSRFELEAELTRDTQKTSGAHELFGARFASGNYVGYGPFIEYGSGNTTQLRYKWNSASVTVGNIDAYFGKRVTVTLDGSVCAIEDENGNALSDAVQTGWASHPYPFALFVYRNSGTANYDSAQAGKFKLYRFRVYEGAELVRDFRPVMDANGVACLYEAVTDELHYNAGTGSFVAGPAV